MTIFLPCRRGSQRVPRKNTRPFAGVPGGLLEIKLRQLMELRSDCVLLVSSNDDDVLALAAQLLADSPLPYRIEPRPDHLGSSSTSTDELIRYVPSLVNSGDVLWTHVTSPFIEARHYEAAIDAYRGAVSAGSHDSLVGVTLRQTFLWNERGPINYDRGVERWPRTQTLEKLWEINSAMFIAPIDTYRDLGDRIGDTPVLFEIDELDSMEIDRQEQFEAAERLMLAKLGR